MVASPRDATTSPDDAETPLFCAPESSSWRCSWRRSRSKIGRRALKQLLVEIYHCDNLARTFCLTKSGLNQCL